MRVLAAAILLLATAAPASADITVRGKLGAGPAFGGDGVVWGEEARSGAARVVTGPDTTPAVRYEDEANSDVARRDESVTRTVEQGQDYNIEFRNIWLKKL